MLYIAAILFVGIGSALLLTCFFALLAIMLIEVLRDKEINTDPNMERFITAGVLIGVMLFVLGGIIQGVDAFLKIA